MPDLTRWPGAGQGRYRGYRRAVPDPKQPFDEGRRPASRMPISAVSSLQFGRVHPDDVRRQGWCSNCVLHPRIPKSPAPARLPCD